MRAWIVLLALTGATVALRLWGIDHLLPHGWQIDNQMAFQAALLREEAREPDGELRDIQYPVLIPRLIAGLSGSPPVPPASAPLQRHLEAASFDILAARVGVALLSSLLVPLTYLLARRFLGAGASLFAAALIATSLLVQTFAQQARPHAAAASVFLASVLASMALARRPTWTRHALAAAAAFLALGALHNGLAVLVPLGLAWFLGPLRGCATRRERWMRWWLGPPVMAAVVAGAFLAFYPFALRDGPGAAQGRPAIVGTAVLWANHRLDLRDLDGGGFATIARGLWSYDPVLVVLVVVAAALHLTLRARGALQRERRVDAWVAGSYALAYLLVIGLFDLTYRRFAIPLLPFLAVFAASGPARASAWSRRSAFAAGAALLVLALPTYAVGRLAWLRSRDDTLERAARWLAQADPAELGRVWVEPRLDLPLARTAGNLNGARFLPVWTDYGRARGADALPRPHLDLAHVTPGAAPGYDLARLENDPRGFLEALGPGLYVADVSSRISQSSVLALHAVLRERATLVLRCAPESEGPTQHWGFDDEDILHVGLPDVLPRLLRASALGPVVEIYCLDPRRIAVR